MVAFIAIGKGCAFTLVVALWLAGAAVGTGALLGIGDLVLAGIFARWLASSA